MQIKLFKESSLAVRYCFHSSEGGTAPRCSALLPHTQRVQAWDLSGCSLHVHSSGFSSFHRPNTPETLLPASMYGSVKELIVSLWPSNEVATSPWQLSGGKSGYGKLIDHSDHADFISPKLGQPAAPGEDWLIISDRNKNTNKQKRINCSSAAQVCQCRHKGAGKPSYWLRTLPWVQMLVYFVPALHISTSTIWF